MTRAHEKFGQRLEPYLRKLPIDIPGVLDAVKSFERERALEIANQPPAPDSRQWVNPDRGPMHDIIAGEWELGRAKKKAKKAKGP